jgi:LysM repeat protein
MSRKIFATIVVLVLFVLAFLGTPFMVQAGGVCGGTYIVEQGQTFESIAAICGTTVDIIITANPGISGALSAGQALMVPGSNYLVTVTPSPGTPVPGTPVPSTPTPVNTYNNYYNYYTYNYYNALPSSYNGTYIVQPGDTFSVLAGRFGVSIYDLWTANPNIVDINLLYVGQVIRVPATVGAVIVPSSTPYTPTDLSYGTVPLGSPTGKIYLSPKTSADIYVSLQGTTRDGINFIREYTVNDPMTVKVPAGWYTYVAWVGGLKFEGQLNLSIDGARSILFYDKKVSTE